MIGLALLCLVCAGVPAAVFFANLRAYRPPSPVDGASLPAVSVLIPARDEAHGIAAAVRAVLASRGVEFEVVVMDDGSTDGTDTIVQRLAKEDARVRLERAPALPGGWNGKQHACWALAQVARYPVLCFVDADVRLEPECVARMAGFLAEGKNGLVSGFPRQVTETFLEWMLLPLIHFVLLGFLPMGRMRAGTEPGFAAGCGQFLMVEREAYFACGGHSGIKLTMHDGLRLPRLFREHGSRTDLADITGLASCRMYTSAGQVWSGLAKNATEGIAAPARIVPLSAVLVLGQVLPFVGLLWTIGAGCYMAYRFHFAFSWDFARPWLASLLLLTIFGCSLMTWSVRFAAAKRFKQDWRSALLHPLGICLLLGVQWYALVRKVFNRPVSWRNRAYAER